MNKNLLRRLDYYNKPVIECQSCHTRRSAAGINGIVDNCPYTKDGLHNWSSVITKGVR